MSPVRIVLLTLLAMLAFAANSLLSRAAFISASIDAQSFTSIRLVSGALCLWLLFYLSCRSGQTRATGQEGKAGDWYSALALFIYALCFSLSYTSIGAATGALVLFAAVQATMVGYGLWCGERLSGWQWLGLALAGAGLVLLLLPGLSAPPLGAALVMLLAGIAWGVYSLRGRQARDATAVSAGNFARASVITLGASLLFYQQLQLSGLGVVYAVASGALASGLGYVIWYSVLPWLRASTAASVQLSVPLITALGGLLLLGEAFSLQLLVAALIILGGIALVISQKPR